MNAAMDLRGDSWRRGAADVSVANSQEQALHRHHRSELGYLAAHVTPKLLDLQPLIFPLTILKSVFIPQVDIIKKHGYHIKSKIQFWGMPYLFWVGNQNGGGTYFGYFLT